MEATYLLQDVIQRAQGGDRDAFDQIIEWHYDRVFHYIKKLMRDNVDDAFELTQETFLKGWLNIKRTATSPHDLRVTAWLYRIAYNLAMDLQRHRKVLVMGRLEDWAATYMGIDKFEQPVGQTYRAAIAEQLLVSSAEEQPDRSLEQQEQAAIIWRELSRLRPEYRLVMLLREYYELSYDELADVLGSTRNAIKSRLFRARVQLREAPAMRALVAVQQ